MLAAFSFFTRLPFWRLAKLPKEAYAHVVEWWPLVGWLTGGVMVGVIYLSLQVFPGAISVLLGIAARILLMGALHEDGLCDFFDGFGGGRGDIKLTLEIMRDSRVGTFGVLGMILYVALIFQAQLLLLYKISYLALMVIWVGDSYSKMLAGQIIMMLPYARTEEEAKNKVVYRRMNISACICLALQGLIPLILLIYFFFDNYGLRWDYIIYIPCLTMFVLYLLLKNRLGGYTGDCCGAICLIIELSFLYSVAIACI